MSKRSKLFKISNEDLEFFMEQEAIENSDNNENIDITNAVEYQESVEALKLEYKNLITSVENLTNEYNAILDIKNIEIEQKHVLEQLPETITSDMVQTSQESLNHIISKHKVSLEGLECNKISVETMIYYPIEAYRVSTEGLEKVLQKLGLNMQKKASAVNNNISKFFTRLKNLHIMATTMFTGYKRNINKIIEVASRDMEIKNMISNIKYADKYIDAFSGKHSGAGTLLAVCKGNLTYEYIKKIINEYDQLAKNCLNVLTKNYTEYKNVLNLNTLGKGITELYKYNELCIDKNLKQVAHGKGLYAGVFTRAGNGSANIWVDDKTIIDNKVIALCYEVENFGYNNQTWSGSLTNLYRIKDELDKVIKHSDELFKLIREDEKKLVKITNEFVSKLNNFTNSDGIESLKDELDKKYLKAFVSFRISDDLIYTIYNSPSNKWFAIDDYCIIISAIIKYVRAYVHTNLKFGSGRKGWNYDVDEV